jgi:hypothetical protein
MVDAECHEDPESKKIIIMIAAPLRIYPQDPFVVDKEKRVGRIAVGKRAHCQTTSRKINGPMFRESSKLGR